MESIITNPINYNGKVNIKFKLNNKVIGSASKKNEGTILLKKAFAMIMCGGDIANLALDRYLPSKLDILKSSDNGHTWNTCLVRPVPATSPAYIFNPEVRTIDVDEDTWNVVYSSSIPYESLAEQPNNSNLYKLCLMCNTIENDSSALAYIDLSSDILSKLEKGVSMLVEWNLCILNNPEAEQGE